MLTNRSLKVFAAILVKAGTNGRDDPEAHLPPGGWPGFAGMSRSCWFEGLRELLEAGLVYQEGTGRRAVLFVLEGGLVPEGDGTVTAAVSRVYRTLLTLSPIDLRAFLALTLAADKVTGESFANMDTVAAWAGMPRRTFYRALGRLKAAGFYRRFRKGRWRIIPGSREGGQFGYVRRDVLERFGICMGNRPPSGTNTVRPVAPNRPLSGTEPSGQRHPTVRPVAPISEPDQNPVKTLGSKPGIRSVCTDPTSLIPANWLRPVEPEREFTRQQALVALQGWKPTRDGFEVANKISLRAGWPTGRYRLPLV